MIENGHTREQPRFWIEIVLQKQFLLFPIAVNLYCVHLCQTIGLYCILHVFVPAFTSAGQYLLLYVAKKVATVSQVLPNTSVSTAMSSLLFHVLLILGLLGACSSYALRNITIQVSDSGLDEPSCLQNETACKTLTYVLGKLPKISFHQSTSITVNITCNQTIKTDSSYSFPKYHYLSVRIVSHNKAYIILNSSMEIIHYDPSYNNYWAWIGVGFISSTNSSINHDSIKSLVILDCRIMKVDWKFMNMRNLVINNSEFGQVDICPTLQILFLSFQLHFIFSNNTVSDCSIKNSTTGADASGKSCSYSFWLTA